MKKSVKNEYKNEYKNVYTFLSPIYILYFKYQSKRLVEALTSMFIRYQSVCLVPEIVATQQQTEMMVLFRHSVVHIKWNANIRSGLRLARSCSPIR